MLTKLKIARMESGIKQWRLANLLGISQVQLSNYELGRYRVPADKRYEIAKILNRPVLELFPTETEGDKI